VKNTTKKTYLRICDQFEILTMMFFTPNLHSSESMTSISNLNHLHLNTNFFESKCKNTTFRTHMNEKTKLNVKCNQVE